MTVKEILVVVGKAREFTKSLRENNWNLQSPDTLASFIADALDATLDAIDAAKEPK